MTQPGQHPATCARREFAAILGCKPGYVTQLIAQGRVVLTDDGKLVRVAESLARIRATRDPAHQPVADRHAASRGQALADDEQPDDYPAANPTQAPQRPDAAAVAGNSYQQARAVKERFLALEAKRAYEVAMGQLRDVREVEHAVATAFTATRTALQNLAQTLAPVLAATTTEEAARTEMATAFEAILAELSTTLATMATPTK